MAEQETTRKHDVKTGDTSPTTISCRHIPPELQRFIAVLFSLSCIPGVKNKSSLTEN